MKFVGNFAFVFLAAAILAVCADGAESQTAQTLNVHVGSNYGGGIVFYVDGSGHGLIAAMSDQGTGTTWYDAKKLCNDYRGGGYSDWIMPSADQMELLYLQRNQVGGFNNQWAYWSSTEGDGGAAYNGVSVVWFGPPQKAFSAGSIQVHVGVMSLGNFVRAIRSF